MTIVWCISHHQFKVRWDACLLTPLWDWGFCWASMKLNKTYINIRDKWWGLPLILPSILLPVLSSANTYALTSTGNVVLFYLPLAFMLSLMLFFGWAALPGIVLAIFWRRYPQTGLYETLSVTMHFIITIVLSWGGYRVFSPGEIMFPTATPTCCFNECSGRYFVQQHYFWSSTSLPLLLACTKVKPAWWG